MIEFIYPYIYMMSIMVNIKSYPTETFIMDCNTYYLGQVE